jgi:hypothetical protein
LNTVRAIRFILKSPSDTFFDLHLPFFIQTASGRKPNTKTRPSLKGSRKLQNFEFTGGLVSGIATGGGVATGIGSVNVMNNTGLATSTGTGLFSTMSGASGFVDSYAGMAMGTAAGGSTGSQIGSASGMLGVGTLGFTGTTTTNGMGGFGAGFSPVQFTPVTTVIPGSLIVTQGSPKGGNSMAYSDPTSSTVFVPSSTGPTGGFGLGGGGINIVSTTTGTLAGGNTTIGSASSIGAGTNSGGGMSSGINYFGGAGGVGSGAGTGGATGAGNTMFDLVGGTFTGTGSSISDFSNLGVGVFGGNGGLTFPGFP